MQDVKQIIESETQAILFLGGKVGKKAIYALFGKVMLAKQLGLLTDNETNVYIDLLFDRLKEMKKGA